MANLSKAGFARRLKALIEAHEPFVAYWHSHGYGVMRLNPVTVGMPYCGRVKHVKVKAGKNAPMAWKKNLMKMRRKYFTEVVAVDFDGEHIMTEGEIDL